MVDLEYPAGDGARRLCLNMIVKDEEHVIGRCLASALPFIDSWAIVDTGSTDRTMQIIREVLGHLPGELHQRPWKDFATNRNEALALAKKWATHTLVMDADSELVAEPGFALPEMTADGYYATHRMARADTSFKRIKILSNRRPWRYVGAVHEVLVCDEAQALETLSGITCLEHSDSARNKVGARTKYMRDAELIERILRVVPDDRRHVFYLAQSLRDAGETARAIDAYRRRVALGGWDEEVWYAQYQVGALHLLREEEAAGTHALLAAHAMRPSRAEALHALAVHARRRKDWALAYMFARNAAEIPYPDRDLLFISESIYRWRALDELSIAAYYVERFEESRAAARTLLASSFLPADQRDRVAATLGFAEAKLT